ncbi:putative petidyl-tRNA hydrolase [Efunavirus H1]|uniref:peptidyl-tRNA hydrolase n=1 Tax=Enterococcus phage H1 TaxID=2982918 RepID=A0AAE9P5A5_9CAUD|nr:putative petidyl-tRNA hydrolase [Enterococcus phage H1]
MGKIVEYILVNKELNMGVGKIAGQVAHVQTVIDNKIFELDDKIYFLSEEILDEDIMDTRFAKEKELINNYYDWFHTGPQTKIILRAKEKDLLKAIDMGAIYIIDKGLTEIPPGSLTAVGFFPQPKDNLVDFTKKFQLL